MPTTPDTTQRHEHRRHPRVTVSWTASIQSDSSERVSVNVLDFSLGGIGLISNRPFSLGDVFTITLEIPTPGVPDKPSSTQLLARLMTQVPQEGGFRLGMAFVDITRRAIEREIRDAEAAKDESSGKRRPRRPYLRAGTRTRRS